MAQRAKDCDGVYPGYQCQPEISHHWGQYSPYFSVPSEISAEIPRNCQLDFVQVLSRHGARAPTFDKSAAYATLLVRLQKHVRSKSFSGKYAFLKDYQYTLGADDLTVFGQREMVHSGTKFYKRYKSIASKGVPFVRASGSDRVVMSAQNFSQGFHAARDADAGSGDAAGGYPYRIIVISEGEEQNNTLSHGLCIDFEYGKPSQIGDDKEHEWRDRFAPKITKRLNKHLHGADLEDRETIYLMEMCPFDTIASPTGKVSPFCDLFTEKEFRAYAYQQSVSKYYSYGAGNPLGPTQGVGWVNELIARLTQTPVHDHTSVNQTLDSDPRTFPMGGQANVFADFSHDNDMVSIFFALGLYNETERLPTDKERKAERASGYSASWAVPFGARAYFEKMTCEGVQGELVRVLVNDCVIPMKTCGSDELGWCKLDRFVESLSFAAEGGRWDDCFK